MPTKTFTLLLLYNTLRRPLNHFTALFAGIGYRLYFLCPPIRSPLPLLTPAFFSHSQRVRPPARLHHTLLLTAPCFFCSIIPFDAPFGHMLTCRTSVFPFPLRLISAVSPLFHVLPSSVPPFLLTLSRI